jgi:hypothetical protein
MYCAVSSATVKIDSEHLYLKASLANLSAKNKSVIFCNSRLNNLDKVLSLDLLNF